MIGACPLSAAAELPFHESSRAKQSLNFKWASHKEGLLPVHAHIASTAPEN